MLCCAVSDEVLENVALHKPSFQVSTLAMPWSTGAINGNDGDRVYKTAHSLRETNPWWAVDLEAPTVNFTNTEDYYGT